MTKISVLLLTTNISIKGSSHKNLFVDKSFQSDVSVKNRGRDIHFPGVGDRGPIFSKGFPKKTVFRPKSSQNRSSLFSLE